METWWYEEWKTIPSYPMYSVSSAGRVVSYKDPRLGPMKFPGDNPLRIRSNCEPTLLKPKIHRLGYLCVYLSNYGDKRYSKHYIHRLVAEAFVPNPENKPEVNHINGIKSCNYAINLEWCTRQENMEHARNTGLINEDTYKRTAESNMRKVYCYELKHIFNSIDEAASSLNLFKSSISLCCQGKSNHAGSYHFCYIDDKDTFLKYIDEIKAREGGMRRVKAINVNTDEERIFSSRKEASKTLGISGSYISNIIAGRSFQTCGWTFEDATPNKFKEVL